jgi:hypothetical protein
MSAAYLELAWDVQNEVNTFSVSMRSVTGAALDRPFALARNPARCPQCRSIIYSRRHRLCGVCNQPLPEHLLFSIVEAQRVEQLLRVERDRHRQWMEQRKLANV